MPKPTLRIVVTNDHPATETCEHDRMQRMEAQSIEFDALLVLVKMYDRLVDSITCPDDLVVDLARCNYEQAVSYFVTALRNNRRID